MCCDQWRRSSGSHPGQTPLPEFLKISSSSEVAGSISYSSEPFGVKKQTNQKPSVLRPFCVHSSTSLSRDQPTSTVIGPGNSHPIAVPSLRFCTYPRHCHALQNPSITCSPPPPSMSLYSSHSSPTHEDPPASATWVLRFQVCVTRPAFLSVVWLLESQGLAVSEVPSLFSRRHLRIAMACSCWSTPCYHLSSPCYCKKRKVIRIWWYGSICRPRT